MLFVYSEAHYGRLLAPYLEDPAHVFIVSSDFCHWGTRFNYVFYDRSRARPSFDPTSDMAGLLLDIVRTLDCACRERSTSPLSGWTSWG